MILIGINGEAGAGKTVLSETLLFGTDRVVVHLDHIFDSVMKLIPKSIVSSDKRETGEEVRIVPKNSVIRKVANSKCASPIVWLYAKMVLERLINKYEKAGYEYFIIEGFYLEKCINLENLDYSIYVSAPYNTRYDRVVNRNTKDEIAKKGNSAIEKNNANLSKYNICVTNTGSLEEYLEKIKTVEKQIVSQKMERIKRNNK